MTGPHGPLAAYAVLTALLAAGCSWLTLVRRYAGRGRLLGTWRSAGLAAATVAGTAAVAVAANLLLPRASGLSSVVVGVAAGAGVATSHGRRPDTTTRTLVKAATLGIAHLTERLEQRMATDRADWCDPLMEDFKEFRQMQTFIQDIATYRLHRTEDEAIRKAVRERLSEAMAALAAAAETQNKIDANCMREGHTLGPRQRTLPEEREYASSRAEAISACTKLLFLQYQYGRRSDDAAILRIRQQAAPMNAFHSAPLPEQRRRRIRLGRRS